MNAAFLLRFQEQCLPNDSLRNRMADPTVTKIAAEQPDVDCLNSNHHTFVSVPSAADPTKTAIKAEAPDEAIDSSLTVIPRLLPHFGPTGTTTAIQAEAPDEAAESGLMALPHRFSLSDPTGTFTAIRAEADDTHLGQPSNHALPLRGSP